MNIEYVKYFLFVLHIAVAGCDSSSASSQSSEIPTNTGHTSSCSQKDTSESLLDVAISVINTAKNHLPTCDNYEINKQRIVDCADIIKMGHKKNGVYKVSPMNRVTEDKFLEVYCDMKTDGGGWTLIQRRGDFGRPKDYFFKDWKSYKEGFGDVEKDFWLGNDNIFALTSQKLYSVRFDLKDVENNSRYAQYGTFWIDDEYHKYTLHISDYFGGDAGDSMITVHNNKKFSTKDEDNDDFKDNCAQSFKGAWWYGSCHRSNLNGMYHKGKHETHADGVNWFTWKHHNESLESSEIKIRPKNFKPS